MSSCKAGIRAPVGVAAELSAVGSGRGVCTQKQGGWGWVLLLPVNRKWSICGWPQWEEGVRVGLLPGKTHFFPLPFRSSILSPQPPVSGSGVEVGGSEEGRGKHLLSMGGLAAGLSQCGWMGSGLGPAGSGRDLLQGWLQMAHSRNH